MDSERITLDEWRAAMEQAMEAEPAGLTVYELAQGLGVNERVVRERLRRLSGEGRLSVSRKRAVSIDGASRWVPVYSIRPKS